MDGLISQKYRGLVIGLLLTGFSATGWAQTSSKAAPGCTEVPLLEPRPLWISSATYVDNLEKVAVIDPLRSDILLIDSRGNSETFKKRLTGVEEKMAPANLSRTPEGFVLSTVDQRLYWLDRRLNPTRPNPSSAPPLAKESITAPGTIVSTYQSVVSGRDFFSFGAVKSGDGKFHFGFFRAPLAKEPGFNFLLDFDNDVDYYLLGHRYITGLQGREYAVLMSDRAVIAQFLDDGSERILDVIPEPYRKIQRLQTDSSVPNSEEAIFKEIESLSIPVGLYGRDKDGLLYLLTREPKASGGTLWQLFPIDPDRPQVLKPIQLPTNANHLTLVDSLDDWYIFEKGPVQSTGKQEISSLLIIPSPLVRSHSVPKKCLSRLK